MKPSRVLEVKLPGSQIADPFEAVIDEVDSDEED
jgi:hypothetical protein